MDMASLAHAAVVPVILANLALLASSRLVTCIRLVALQGAVISVTPLFFEAGPLTAHTAILCAVALALKGMVFPALMQRTLRRVPVRHEIEPYLGYPLSILLGILGLFASMWLAGRLGVPDSSSRAFAAAFATILTGLLLIVTRKKAFTQVLGYLTAENGIFLLTAVLAPGGPLFIELAILLDVFVAVFVMGIAIHHISRQFDSIDTDRFCSLKD
jgi:hydrogenase-4 component E